MFTKKALETFQQIILSSFVDFDDRDAVLIPANMIVNDLDFLKPCKKRIAATYTTASIEDFCEYLRNKESGLMAKGMPCPSVFVAMDSLAATAIIDFGSIEKPGHCTHKALLELMVTPEWKAICEIDNKKIPQNEFIDWCIDWRDCLGFVDANHVILDRTPAINAYRKITMDRLRGSESSVESLKQSQSAMEKIEAKYAGVTPAYVHFMGKPAEELSDRAAVIRTDISLDSADKEVLIKTRWMQRELLAQTVQSEFRQMLKMKLADCASVYSGSIII